MPSGSCLCRDVRYRIGTSLKWITHCHCSMCRKQHGAAFATYATVGSKHVAIDDPHGRLVKYRSSETVDRTFCGRCGSSLFWQRVAVPKLVDVAVATLDDDLGHAPDAHIFVGSKAGWWHIDDDLPQHPESAPEPPG